MNAHVESFSAEDQAIWIDRHNFFRSTGLPWAAGNMRRVGWSADLASSAASTAAQCSASTVPGMNMYQSTSTNSASLIDEAIQQWVVKKSQTTLKTITQPGATGVPVGAGTYDSYSQVLWASTTSIGCAKAECPGGDLVVCKYAPAGNDGSSPWYIHAEMASKCPSGTKGLQGLCIVEGDAANNPIAPIPVAKLTYEVYPSYAADIQTILVDTARAIANGSAASFKEEKLTRLKEQTATTDGPSPLSEDITTKNPSKSSTPSSSSTLPSSPPDASETSSKPTPGSSGKSNSVSISAGETKQGLADFSPKQISPKTVSEINISEDEEAPLQKPIGSFEKPSEKSNSDSPAALKTDKKMDTAELSDDASKLDTVSSNSNDMAPGKVKASLDTGSQFSNQAAPESSTDVAPDDTPTTETPSEANSKDTPPSPNVSQIISNQSNTADTSGGISAAGMAGVIVLVVVFVAAFGVVVSYRRNQKRQREIMRDGGIRYL
ncbi:hypothetical protein CCR75_007182 [Bremia lactucae]|uniref:SCP domain-containing protein n=1 Tax=Bremia lactucae TaxID=4779 RepID=A0A976IBX4_BRELC|nr:hypothetical protein CCR75_007019 [Bremia lactucae]TDH66465.1 hypothetical protein CCR75_007182 [Bremia lactucae]